MTDPVPYETLVRWQAVFDRLEDLADELHDCAQRAGEIVERLSGRFDDDGNPLWARNDALGKVLGDEFWAQLGRDGDRLLKKQREGAGADA